MNSVSTLVARYSTGSRPGHYRHALAANALPVNTRPVSTRSVNTRRPYAASNQHIFRSPVHQAVATTAHAAAGSALGADAVNPMNATASPGIHGIVAGLIMLVALAGVAVWMLKLLVQLWFG
jgi:hypothetical protein